MPKPKRKKAPQPPKATVTHRIVMSSGKEAEQIIVERMDKIDARVTKWMEAEEVKSDTARLDWRRKQDEHYDHQTRHMVIVEHFLIAIEKAILILGHRPCPFCAPLPKKPEVQNERRA